MLIELLQARLIYFPTRDYDSTPADVGLPFEDLTLLAGDGVALLQALAETLRIKTGKNLPINVDGAIAALLVDLGMPRELANGFFIMARVPGLMAHVSEEKSRMRPMRRIHPTDHSYDGPQDREVPT